MSYEKLSSLFTALKLDEKPLTNQFMYIEEHNNADGSFILSAIMKDEIEKNNNIILLLCHNSFVHFQSISQKLSYNLIPLKMSGELYVIDVLELIVNENFLDSESQLREIYYMIKEKIKEWGDEKGVCIILENIGNLLIVDVKEIFQFIHYIRTIALNLENSSAICSMHSFSGCDDELIINLRHFSDIIVILKDLQTGRANDVTGHLIVKRKEENHTKSINEYHYQLQDKSFFVFAPGSGNFV